MRYLIETSVIIDYIRGKREVVSLVDGLEGELSSSYVCLAELYEGIFRVQEKKRAERAVLEFFSSMSEIYSVDREIAESFGKIRVDLKNKGEVIEDLDILIAATCLAKGLTLVTSNPRHFKRIKNLDVLTP